MEEELESIQLVLVKMKVSSLELLVLKEEEGEDSLQLVWVQMRVSSLELQVLKEEEEEDSRHLVWGRKTLSSLEVLALLVEEVHLPLLLEGPWEAAHLAGEELGQQTQWEWCAGRLFSQHGGQHASGRFLQEEEEVHLQNQEEEEERFLWGCRGLLHRHQYGGQLS